MAERLSKPVEIYSMGKGNGSDYLLPFRLARIMKKLKPDIVHTRNWSAIDGVIGAKIAGIKSVIHGEHGREVSDLRGTKSVRKKVRKFLNPWISKFITVSLELREWLLKDVGIPEEKVVQITNGVDIERFKPSDDKNLSKIKSGFPLDLFILGTVGRLDRVKDFQTIIKAFAYLTIKISKTNKIRLLIIGSGPENQKLKILAKELRVFDKILFLGERKDIPELMQSMDIFILPSIAEGISNTILEAMACGLPVVATKVGGTPELIDDGKTGFLFTPGDYNELADRLFLYSTNSSTLGQHGVNGRLKTVEKLSLSKMAGKYEELYCSISSC